MQAQSQAQSQADKIYLSSDDDTINLSEIEDAVLQVLPKIGAVRLASLIETLVDPKKIGVASASDLTLVVESDISHLLSAIEVRKLISSWKNTGKLHFQLTFSHLIGNHLNLPHLQYLDI